MKSLEAKHSTFYQFLNSIAQVQIIWAIFRLSMLSPEPKARNIFSFFRYYVRNQRYLKIYNESDYSVRYWRLSFRTWKLGRFKQSYLILMIVYVFSVFVSRKIGVHVARNGRLLAFRSGEKISFIEQASEQRRERSEKEKRRRRGGR